MSLRDPLGVLRFVQLPSLPSFKFEVLRDSDGVTHVNLKSILHSYLLLKTNISFKEKKKNVRVEGPGTLEVDNPCFQRI